MGIIFLLEGNDKINRKRRPVMTGCLARLANLLKTPPLFKVPSERDFTCIAKHATGFLLVDRAVNPPLTRCGPSKYRNTLIK